MIPPYIEAGEVLREKSEQPARLLKKGLQIGSSLGGASLFAKAVPFLAEGLTPSMVIKGLNSINPKFGKFVNEALKHGKSLNEVKDFISEKLNTAQNAAPESLFQKLVKGMNLESLEPGQQKEMGFIEAIAGQLEGKGKTEKDPEVIKLKKKIQKILKGKGALATGYMQEVEEEPPQVQMQQPGYNEQVMPPQGDQMQQPGSGQQALMAILQKIQSQRGM